MKILYIVRGPFGTGKTEFANTICDHVVSCWDYYTQYGKDTWDEKLKPYADQYCQTKVAELMQQGIDKIAVTNSFSKNDDLDYFYDLAEKNDYQVFCTIIDNRNSALYHRDVPENVILKQAIKLKSQMASWGFPY